MCNRIIAQSIAITAHHTQERRSGEPYINHPLRVADMAEHLFQYDPHAAIVATLHDVIEDSVYTAETLQLLGFNEKIVDAVVLLTREKGLSRGDYIQRILESTNTTALRVKLLDAIDNSTWSYLDRDSKKPDLWCVKRKYYRQLAERLHARLCELDPQVPTKLMPMVIYTWNQMDRLSLKEFALAHGDRSTSHYHIGCTRPHTAIINDNQYFDDTWEVDLFEGIHCGDYVLPILAEG